jgi:formylmethanofuran dehydrogenase subunit E
MLRVFIFLTLCAATTVCLAHDPSQGLPPPRYQPKPSDPAWLAPVVQLHGHLGPWVVAGARLGMAGARAVEAKGHFDVQVTCEGPFEKPPRSCFLDGVQLGTGATLGKRTLAVVDGKQIVVKVRNLHSGKTVEVRPTRRLINIIEPLKGTAGPSVEQVEQLARDIAAMPEEEILTILRLAGVSPHGR